MATTLRNDYYYPNGYRQNYDLNLGVDSRIFLEASHDSGYSAVYDKRGNLVQDLRQGPIFLEEGSYTVQASYSSPTYAVLAVYSPELPGKDPESLQNGQTYKATTYDQFYQFTLERPTYVTLDVAHDSGYSAVYDSDLNHLLGTGRGEILLNPGSYLFHADFSSPTYAEFFYADRVAHLEKGPLWGDYTSNVITGKSVSDEILGLYGDDEIRGRGGNDRIQGGQDSDTIFGNSGNDTLTGGEGDDFIDGGFGADRIFAGSGDEGVDWYEGDEGDDRFVGGAGYDILGGGVGNDTLEGDAGIDSLYGGAGDDRLYAGSEDGSASRFGGVIWSGTGNDLAVGDNGKDLLGGGAGNDTVNGRGGNDTIYLADGRDSAEGGSGHDTIYGGSGDNRIFGNDGDDTIFNGDGSGDRVDGGAGADLIWGGTGYDHLRGGPGADTFSFVPGNGHDTISDFSLSDGDKLDLRGLNINSEAEALSLMSGIYDAEIEVEDVSITIEGLEADLLSATSGWLVDGV